MSLAHMGHGVSPATREKISAAMTGHPTSSETKAKISAAKWRGGIAVWGPKSWAKHRALGFIPLNEPFKGSEGHHIDKEHVVYVLKKLHRSIRHNVWTGEGMKEINELCMSTITEVI